MSVNPGFGGQKFIANTYKKLHDLTELCTRKSVELLIEVDGGVDDTNIAQLTAAGANVFVAGNAVFSATDPAGMISKLKSLSAAARS
jgi:ribulose-phosphate 3-epimerase